MSVGRGPAFRVVLRRRAFTTPEAGGPRGLTRPAPHLTSDTAGMSDRWLLARDSSPLRDNSRRGVEAEVDGAGENRGDVGYAPA